MSVSQSGYVRRVDHKSSRISHCKQDHILQTFPMQRCTYRQGSDMHRAIVHDCLVRIPASNPTQTHLLYTVHLLFHRVAGNARL